MIDREDMPEAVAILLVLGFLVYLFGWLLVEALW